MFDTDTLTDSEYHRHAKEIEAAEDEWEIERAHENAAERTLTPSSAAPTPCSMNWKSASTKKKQR